jgi:pimeloyl-ACP methyl ester carboxylesterase
MPYQTANNVRLFYTDCGPREADTIVFVHGWTCDSHDWSSQLAALGEDFRVIAPDLRGHGRSDVPRDGYHPRSFAQDIWILLDRLGVRAPVLVGHSLGGTIVSVMAASRPGHARGLVTLDPAFGFGEDFREKIPPQLRAFRGEDGLNAAAHNISSRRYGPNAPTWLRVLHHRRALGMPQHVVADTFEGLYLGPGRYGLQPASSKLIEMRGCPSLAIYTNETRAELERNLVEPPSAVLVWTDTGHFIQQEEPDRLNAVLRGWLVQLPAGAAGRS